MSVICVSANVRCLHVIVSWDRLPFVKVPPVCTGLC